MSENNNKENLINEENDKSRADANPSDMTNVSTNADTINSDNPNPIVKVIQTIKRFLKTTIGRRASGISALLVLSICILLTGFIWGRPETMPYVTALNSSYDKNNSNSGNNNSDGTLTTTTNKDGDSLAVGTDNSKNDSREDSKDNSEGDLNSTNNSSSSNSALPTAKPEKPANSQNNNSNTSDSKSPDNKVIDNSKAPVNNDSKESVTDAKTPKGPENTTPTTTTKKATTPPAVVTPQVTATCTKKGGWQNGDQEYAQYNLIINNKSSKTISNWKVVITFSSKVEALSYNGTATVSGNTLTLTPAEYNNSVDSNKTLDYGFQVNSGSAIKISSIKITYQ